MTTGIIGTEESWANNRQCLYLPLSIRHILTINLLLIIIRTFTRLQRTDGRTRTQFRLESRVHFSAISAHLTTVQLTSCSATVVVSYARIMSLRAIKIYPSPSDRRQKKKNNRVIEIQNRKIKKGHTKIRCLYDTHNNVDIIYRVHILD